MSNVKSFDVKAFTDTVRILKIVSTQKRDSGIYQCFLQNKAGKVNGALEIVVEQASMFTIMYCKLSILKAVKRTPSIYT